MNRIQEHRKLAGVSARRLAAELDWTTSRVGNYEQGLRSPSLDDSREIVYALNRLGVRCTLDTVFPPRFENEVA
ncbi:XRE family transcriptional regulator [Salinicola endophyticus]|uniref:XRE family transcriptional regulator n=2 Tax=Salinicola endophyticus TaxID=1949083 RepID=A0ABY8FC70_9GAMM|nr:XRE family transcriptional regulator [Salinicola endophyticus]